MGEKTTADCDAGTRRSSLGTREPPRGHGVGNRRRGDRDSRARRSSTWSIAASLPESCPVEDVGDRVVLPGLVDTHVHINEPGRTEWEGFETATRAAAAGGITTLVDMPLNSSPVTTTAEALALKIEAARGKLWVDCGFYGGVVPGHERHVGPLIAAGVLGFKAFLCHSGIDEFPNAAEADLADGDADLAAAGLPLLVHAELVSPPICRGAGHRAARAAATPPSRVATARPGSTTRSGS